MHENLWKNSILKAIITNNILIYTATSQDKFQADRFFFLDFAGENGFTLKKVFNNIIKEG